MGRPISVDALTLSVPYSRRRRRGRFVRVAQEVRDVLIGGPVKPRAGSDDRLYIDLGPSADKKHPSRNRFDGTVRECEAILRYWGLLPEVTERRESNGKDV